METCLLQNHKGGWGDPVAFINGLECCTEGIVGERVDNNNNQGKIDRGGENHYQNQIITVQSLTHETSKIFSQSKIDVKAVRYMIAQVRLLALHGLSLFFDKPEKVESFEIFIDHGAALFSSPRLEADRAPAGPLSCSLRKCLTGRRKNLSSRPPP
jgi:hypothetical protein